MSYYGLLRTAPGTLAALLCLPGGLSFNLFGQSSNVLRVAPPQKVAARRNNTVQAKISVSLQPGYHVNSNTPSEDYLIPLRLKWTPGGLEPGEVVYPKPQIERYEFSPKPLSVFSGNFDLVTKFKVAPGVPTGPGVLLGKLRYQACNNNMCFPPTTVEVRLPYQIQ